MTRIDPTLAAADGHATPSPDRVKMWEEHPEHGGAAQPYADEAGACEDAIGALMPKTEGSDA